MRAAVVAAHGPPEGLRLVEDWPLPRPGPGEVLVRTAAFGLNFAELMVIAGTYQALPTPPFVPGEELAGTVAATGPGVSGFAAGDRVLGLPPFGAYADCAVVAEADLFRIPEGMDFATAAAFGAAWQTAWFALTDRGRLEPGETVLVTGAGGNVGLATLQLAKAMGARAVAGIATAAKAAACRDAGADAVVDLSMPDLRDGLRQAVRPDVVVDLVGGPVFEAALRALGWRGRMVVVGFAGGQVPSVKANYLLIKNIAVAGLLSSDYRQRQPDQARRAQAEIFRLWQAGKLRPLATVRRWHELVPALRDIAARRAVGKTVVAL